MQVLETEDGVAPGRVVGVSKDVGLIPRSGGAGMAAAQGCERC